jgi:hypothetical protein
MSPIARNLWARSKGSAKTTAIRFTAVVVDLGVVVAAIEDVEVAAIEDATHRSAWKALQPGRRYVRAEEDGSALKSLHLSLECDSSHATLLRTKQRTEHCLTMNDAYAYVLNKELHVALHPWRCT